MNLKTLTISAASALALGVSAPAHAQTNGWLPPNNTAYASDDYRSSWADSRREAYDNGYREGQKHGTDAARKGKPFDLERERDYRNADEGYHRDLGDKDRYRDNFRRGFAEGYRDAYDRAYRDTRDRYYGGSRDNDRYRDRGWGYGGYGQGYGRIADVAFQNGARDGYQKGIDDARDGKYPDVTRHKWYKNGTRDYDDRYGPKELYQRDYRRGFEEGYRRAFDEGGYYRR